MRYLVKHAKKGKHLLATIPANSESKDIKLVRLVKPKECSVAAIETAIRETYELEPAAEIIMDFIGDWDNTIANGEYQHPFLDKVKVKVQESR